MRIISILFLLIITGCSGQSEDKGSSDFTDFDMEGIVYSLNDDYMTVVSGITSANITRDQWFDQAKPATQFKITKNTEIIGGKLRVGSNVKVWNTGWELDSYPGEAEAKKILVTN